MLTAYRSALWHSGGEDVLPAPGCIILSGGRQLPWLAVLAGRSGPTAGEVEAALPGVTDGMQARAECGSPPSLSEAF